MNTDELFIDGYNLPEPLLDEELSDLFCQLKSGSNEARDKIIIHNIRFVLYEVTSKFKYIDYDKKELACVGIIGLIKAIDTYDISKGNKFLTYAVKCIDNEILLFLKILKRNNNIDSLDKVVFYDKNGSKIKLEDQLSDDTDLVEDNETAETHKIIREIVKDLPKRDREIIMLRFGFYNDRIYKEDEIANMMNLSQPYVSRLVAKNVKQIGKKLELIGVIELKSKQESKIKRLQTIYEYFQDYTKEEIDEMLTKLSDEEKVLVTIRYGEDLNNPVWTKLSNEQSYKFYGLLVPKMKRLLSNPKGARRRKKTKKS